jgi:hypothetical protein
MGPGLAQGLASGRVPVKAPGLVLMPARNRQSTL